MTARAHTLLVALAVTAYCAWSARDIVPSWWNAPYNRLGWIAFLIWLIPLAREAMRRNIEPFALLLWGGLGLSLIGTIGEQNALCYLGFSCALAALPHWSFLCRLLWLAASISWMTVLGYAAERASLSNRPVLMLRLLAAAGAVSLILFLTRRKVPAQT
jgi:hypothetical protein